MKLDFMYEYAKYTKYKKMNNSHNFISHIYFYTKLNRKTSKYTGIL